MNIEEKKFYVFFDFVKKALEEITAEIFEEKCALMNSMIAKSMLEKENSKVVILIGICGKTNGRIVLEGSLDTINNIAVAMNFGDPLDDPDDMYMYIAEFANMFSGRATTFINNEYQDREFWLAPPSVFSAENLEITNPPLTENTAYYITKQGLITVNIGFE